jgi:hypothetical protein
MYVHWIKGIDCKNNEISRRITATFIYSRVMQTGVQLNSSTDANGQQFLCRLIGKVNDVV